MLLVDFCSSTVQVEYSSNLIIRIVISKAYITKSILLYPDDEQLRSSDGYMSI